MKTIDVLTPSTLAELAAGLRRMTPQSRILAGGTDLMIAMRRGEIRPDRLLDISGVKDLHRIRQEANQIIIGAGATFSEILESGLIFQHACCLAQAAAAIGSVQIRNRATLAGNIATASPAGDGIPPLYALAAEVSILNADGAVRRASVEKLFAGPYQTTLKCSEAILDLRFALPDPPAVSTFVKLGSRRTVTIARLNLALALCLKPASTTVSTARVALGAAGRTVFRSAAAERLLGRIDLFRPAADDLADILVREIETAIPGRYSLPYKRCAIVGLARQALDNLSMKCRNVEETCR